VRYKVSHPYKTTGKNIVLYILIFTFLDSRREDKFGRTVKLFVNSSHIDERSFWVFWEEKIFGFDL
jgi:hypothetical protein